MEDMKYLVENYQTHKNQLDILYAKLEKLQNYNTKNIASYGYINRGGQGSVSSKVERCLLDREKTEERIKKLEHKIYIVDIAERILNNKEREVIDLVKTYRNKLTKIAKILGEEKEYVKYKRDTAIKKMSEYIGGKK